MGRGWFITVVLLVSACGPENVARCLRQQVGRTGELNPLIENVSTPELLVVNERAVVRVFAPLTACVSETPGFTVELYDGNNLPLATEPPTLTNLAGMLRIDVPFTPTSPGIYFMRSTFEPNLGARSTTLTVVGPAELDAGVRITMPARCDDVWPLASEAVACAAGDGVTVSFADGGVERFDGGSIVTAGPVLWSVDANTLERRVLKDGVLERTHAFTGFGAEAVAGMHGEHFAIRRTTRGALHFLQLVDGRVADTLVFTVAPPPPRVVVFDGERVMAVGQFGDLVESLLAVEPTHLWQWDMFDRRFLRAWPMPLRASSSPPAPTLLPGRPVSQSPARGPFERLPLWVERSTDGPGDDAVLVSFDDGVLSMSLWPRARVLRVGREVVVLQEPEASTVRLVPKQ